MKAQEIFDTLKEKFPEDEFEIFIGQLPAPAKGDPGHAGDSFIVVPAHLIVDICQILKTIDRFDFDCLSDQTAIDQKEFFEVVYNLFSYRYKHSIALKVKLPREENPKIPTVEGLWPVANWYEREIFDLFGIVFEGHSDLRRIMLPEDWVGHPLRKDYTEQEEYHGISTKRTPLLQ